MMKGIKFFNIPIFIGCANWIITLMILIIMFFSITHSPKVTPKEFYIIENFMGNYLKYSFIPALVSSMLTIKVDKGYKIINLGINLIFLLIYALIFLFYSSVTSG